MADRLFTRRQVLAAGAITAASAAVVAACGSGSSTPTLAPATATPTSGTSVAPSAAPAYAKPSGDVTGTLTISNWGDPLAEKVYAAAAAVFKAKYPNVTINDNFTPITTWTDYVNKVVADVAAGNAPDVINIATEGFRFGLTKSLFYPLDDYLANDPDAKSILSDTSPRLVQGFANSGHQYLVPAGWNGMLIYYNTKMFAAAKIDRPSDNWTWDDFLAIAQKLTTGSGGSKVFGFALPWFGFGLSPWWFSNGTAPCNADLTASNLTDPKMIETATWIRDLVTKNAVAPQPKGADPYQLFPAGKAAMTGAGHWEVQPFKDAGFQDYDILPWPQKTKKATVFGGNGFAIYPQSKSKDLAWEYIKQMTSQDTQRAFLGPGGNPASNSVALDPSFLAFPAHAQLFQQMMEYAVPVNAPTVYPTLDPAVLRAMDSIMAGTDPAQALAAADKEVSDAFKAG